jgi:hypothetical protein
MIKENTTSTSTRNRMVLILLAIAVIASIWFLFLQYKGFGKDEAADILVGEWLRTDGTYTIGIANVAEDGKLTATYFNPNPIHVGRSGWRVKEDQLQIYVELQDENYPGSLYELNYDKEKDRLKGTYYQAVAKKTYDVEFSKK